MFRYLPAISMTRPPEESLDKWQIFLLVWNRCDSSSLKFLTVTHRSLSVLTVTLILPSPVSTVHNLPTTRPEHQAATRIRLVDYPCLAFSRFQFVKGKSNEKSGGNSGAAPGGEWSEYPIFKCVCKIANTLRRLSSGCWHDLIHITNLIKYTATQFLLRPIFSNKLCVF